MNWQLTPYVCAYVVTAAVAAGVSLIAWHRRRGSGAMALTLLMFAVMEWALADALEAAAVGVPAKALWSTVAYVGTHSCPVLFLIFAAQYTRSDRWLTRRNLFLIWVIPVLTILMAATNQWHGLVWSSFAPSPIGNNILIYGHGPWYWLALAYVASMLLTGTVLLVRAAIRFPQLYRRSVAAVLIGSISPWVGTALYTSGRNPIPGLDIIPISFVFAGAVAAWALLRLHLTELVPMARNTLVESMTDGVIVMDAFERVVDFNLAAQQIIGYTAAAALGRPCVELIPSYSRLRAEEGLATEVRAEISMGESDDRRHYDLRMTQLCDSNGALLGRLAVLRDITDYKRSAEALSRSHELLEKVQASLNEAIFLVDLQTRLICNCNPAAERMFGYTRDELIGHDTRILHVNEEMFQEFGREHLDTLDSQEGSAFEFRAKRRNGEVFPTEHYVTPIHTAGGRELVVSVVRDITGRKQAEQALQESERNYRSLFAVAERRAQEMALLDEVRMALSRELDLPTVFRTVVEDIVKTFGYTLVSLYLLEGDELVLQHQVGYVRVLQRIPITKGIVGRVIRTGQPVVLTDVRTDPDFLGAIDGIVSEICVPLYDQQRIVGVLNIESSQGAILDEADLRLMTALSEHVGIAIGRARLYAEAQESREQYRQRAVELAAHNAELDAFAHTVAHDLKNPLGLITGYAELLADGPNMMSDKERLDALQSVVQMGRTAANIIDGLLLLAGVRQTTVAPVPLDMVAIIARAKQRLRHLIREREAEIRLPETLPVALGHAPWIEEVWVNYLTNALLYGDRHDLTPSAPPRVEPGGELIAGDRARFWVRDQGIGIPPAEQARLFTPFTQLAQAHTKGHGLGLSIVRRIVEKLGGEVGVESTGVPGEGSTFYFTLPAAPSSL